MQLRSTTSGTLFLNAHTSNTRKNTRSTSSINKEEKNTQSLSTQESSNEDNRKTFPCPTISTNKKCTGPRLAQSHIYRARLIETRKRAGPVARYYSFEIEPPTFAASLSLSLSFCSPREKGRDSNLSRWLTPRELQKKQHHAALLLHSVLILNSKMPRVQLVRGREPAMKGTFLSGKYLGLPGSRGKIR